MHLLILGPKCLVHFSVEVSETFWYWCRSVHGTIAKFWDTSAPNTWRWNVLGRKCLRSEVSVHRRTGWLP